MDELERLAMELQAEIERIPEECPELRSLLAGAESTVRPIPDFDRMRAQNR